MKRIQPNLPANSRLFTSFHCFIFPFQHNVPMEDQNVCFSPFLAIKYSEHFSFVVFWRILMVSIHGNILLIFQRILKIWKFGFNTEFFKWFYINKCIQMWRCWWRSTRILCNCETKTNYLIFLFPFIFFLIRYDILHQHRL